MKFATNLVEQQEVENLKELIEAAQGKRPATLLLKNCRLVNVYSEEVYETDIAIYQNRIASITKGAVSEAEEVIDCEGCYAMPGFIDPHMHVDTTMLWPTELAKVLVPLGTTTVFVDMTNVVHNGGIMAAKKLADAFKGLPLRAYFSASSYCPLDPEIETAAAEIDSKDVETMLQWENFVSIGETVSSKILNLEPDYLARLQLCENLDKVASGHGGDLPAGDERALDAYIASGIWDDHCVASNQDIDDRLRRGVSMFLVEAPGREQVEGFFRYIKEKNLPTGKMSLCIDNITIMDIVGEYGGYLDNPFRIGLKCGMDLAKMAAMGSLNTAAHYHIDRKLGSITPGRLADLMIIKDPQEFPPKLVVADGKVAARDGKLVTEIHKPELDGEYLHSIHLPENFGPEIFRVGAGGEKAKVRVIAAKDGEAFNRCLIEELLVKDGEVQPDVSRDILKMAIIERYGRYGNWTNGFVTGFELKEGAIATSYSVPSNNIVTVGTNREDMACAVRCLEESQGGFAVVKDGKVLAQVKLPIGGIMSEEPYEDLLRDVETAKEAAHSMGCPLTQPFFTMSQTVLSSLPELGFTDKGIVDVKTGAIVDVLVHEET